MEYLHRHNMLKRQNGNQPLDEIQKEEIKT
jgi:hypothetical protein